jgi:hypothetical protein
VTEYVYEPALLLNEIKRIAKKGARIIATFPALADRPPSNEGDPPSRLRKHYSKEEVEAFGQHLGPGRVLGIHYLGGREPANEEEKNVLLEMERLQPEGEQPLDWVFAGAVDNPVPIVIHHRTLPLDEFAFAITHDASGVVNRIMRLKKRLSGMLSRGWRSAATARARLSRKG